MQAIPVQPVASQTLSVQLNGQNVSLNIYQMNEHGLFMDVALNGVQLPTGVLCQHANPIVRDAYWGMVGDLAWFDTQSLQNPQPPYYTGLGSRWILVYLTPDDLAGLA